MECFIAVCEELHFTRAAEKLGIAQPSLSQQIRNLEDEFGTPLIDRIGKKNVITEAGTILLQHCYNVFHELAQAKMAIRDLQGLQRGSLKAGALLSAIHSVLPSSVAAFRLAYPNIRLSLQTMRNQEIYEQLLHNELDLGIAYLMETHESLESVRLYTETLSLAAPADHPVVQVNEVTLAILQETPSILLPDSYYVRQRINEACRTFDFVPAPVLEMSSVDSILAMVLQGIGVTVLPSSYLAHRNSPAIRVIPISVPAVLSEVGILYRKNKFLCTASRAFIDQLMTSTRSKQPYC